MSTRYHQAASDSYLELLKEATRRDLNLSDEDGMTPTLLAAYHGNLEALEIICSRGGDPNRCDIWGNTPLHYAASNGHTHCVSFLVNFGANIFALDNSLQSPLDAAASREQNECVALLDKAATTQNIMNPKKVTRLKEQAQKNARRQIKECERLQEKHQNKMARNYSKEESGTLSSSNGTFSRSSLANASASGTFGSLSKGIKDTFKLKLKKNKDTAEQVGKESRSGQRNVMEVFREEEEDAFSGDFQEKPQFSAEDDGCVQHESILNRPGLGNIVFRKNKISSPEDMSDIKRGLEFKMCSELLQGQGAAEVDEAEADKEGEENNHDDDLPWDEDEVGWEEDVVDATPLEVFLQSHHLEEFLPIFMREQIDLEALLLCSDEDLQGIHMHLGPRKKVLNVINRRKQVLREPGQLVDTSL
ncbi:ankyrin repeat and SAM domain-containing protein 4B [Canis lupus baileyi]|uniref:Ankyrin repeat and sterile alpha motif domain containing 4B n=3 Tax=Canis lupus TaxID=9612 RepID=A0A8C0MKZ6_CANLF|nr:ankyrin repeat and SAM domain-containing protein 4B isoform X1 [Canis lupus familiaris]XP_025272071.1 ankyrin repeat and SAM domain-containing protein 4B [Canis lupus dingo]XP_038396058.1 ankyrin repeat and SAM domain-containing protein 4B isoform X1 [Canis lupus familiaris]XP_038396060.1 ankyrin repeat and SAM domain-containing protein 4B isoform X1 [Canis lupus familiaris]XP_038401381.1 ankyrin repeat and SAM domain-containing protein 4B isoform X1 [Canis lupus familiaris]XP_038524871.1 a|eukprot:XP_013970046.1 ankyrin repeat and SAM domain-containing protein 4B isoform X1 [Canis lupus familiaris]